MNSFATTATTRLGMGLVNHVSSVVLLTLVIIWDLGLTLCNTFTSLLPEGRVVPEGRPGAQGLWPEFIPPEETDSRSPCPALNAMANHGKYHLRSVDSSSQFTYVCRDSS